MTCPSTTLPDSNNQYATLDKIKNYFESDAIRNAIVEELGLNPEHYTTEKIAPQEQQLVHHGWSVLFLSTRSMPITVAIQPIVDNEYIISLVEHAIHKIKSTSHSKKLPICITIATQEIPLLLKKKMIVSPVLPYALELQNQVWAEQVLFITPSRLHMAGTTSLTRLASLAMFLQTKQPQHEIFQLCYDLTFDSVPSTTTTTTTETPQDTSSIISTTSSLSCSSSLSSRQVSPVIEIALSRESSPVIELSLPQQRQVLACQDSRTWLSNQFTRDEISYLLDKKALTTWNIIYEKGRQLGYFRKYKTSQSLYAAWWREEHIYRKRRQRKNK